MKRRLAQTAVTLGWLAVGAGVSLVIVLALGGVGGEAEAHHGAKSWIRPGFGYMGGLWCYAWNSYPDPKHDCWHPSSIGTAIDYNVSPDDIGLSVYLWLDGDTQHFIFQEDSACYGVVARIYNTQNQYKGEIRYLHIWPQDGIEGYEITGWLQRVGSVHGGPEKTEECPWDGPHLHQDANTAWWTPFYTNWYGNHPWTYSHTICWSGSCP